MGLGLLDAIESAVTDSPTDAAIHYFAFGFLAKLGLELGDRRRIGVVLLLHLHDDHLVDDHLAIGLGGLAPAAHQQGERDGQSNLAAADELLRAVLEKHKGRRSKELSHVYLRLARVARASGDRGNDLAMLGTALDMDGQNGAVASELAWVARELGSTEIETRALRTITMLRAQAPMSRAEAYERLGELALEAGDNKRAVMLLKRAIDDDPSRQLARDLLARID